MSQFRANLKVNSTRLWESLLEMSKVGPGLAGGNNRQTLTDADAEGRQLLKKWCDKEKLVTTVDTMGNMFATRPGTDPNLNAVYVGSHLDTQPTGGKFDGVLGVLGALEIIRTLNDLNLQTLRPIVIVNWTNEEGTRFAPPMMASGVFTGVYTQEWAYQQQDSEGKRFGDELKRIGWAGQEEVGSRKIHTFYELHIEQGPILESENKDIGLVTHGQGLNWLEVTLLGQESHTGTTPMSMRKNAGLGMAQITQLVHDIAMSNQPNAVGAIGQCNVYPNSPNIIPGKVIFTVDFRSPSFEKQSLMESQLREGIRKICKILNLNAEIKNIGHFDPVSFNKNCIDTTRRVTQKLGYSSIDLISGAGHDACWISHIAPTAMIMCPCVGGLSHNEAEDISIEWATAGTNVLLHSVLETATQI